MKHRIRAAGLLIKDNKILLVKHNVHGKVFWVPPGGGLEAPDSSTKDTVIREVFEETGLKVKHMGPLAFIREFNEVSRNIYHVEQFYLIEKWSGKLTTKNLIGLGHDEAFIKGLEWLSKDELQSLVVFPEELKNELWELLENRSFGLHLGVQVEEI